MSRVTPYVKTTWADRPSTSSSIDATNLNHIEQGVKNVTDAVNEMVVEVEPATASKLGGIKVGSGLSIEQDGTLSATGGGGGASDLNDLDDVEVSNPSSGQVLKYNATTSKFENSDESSYTLPIATDSTLGGIKIGSRLTIDQNGILSADEQSSIIKATEKLTGPSSSKVTQSSIFNSEDSNYGGWHAFDENLSGNNAWFSDNGDVTGAWICYHFSEPKNIIKLDVYNRAGTSNINAVKTFKLQSSNDGTTWNDIKTCSISSNTGGLRSEFKISNSNSYEYYRLYITEGWVTTYICIAEIIMYEQIGGESYTLPPATQNTLGGIKVGENLSIEEDGTLSATSGSVESMTYEETINVLDESSYTKINLFQTARTISASGPWNPSPQPLTISEDGLITFSPTGIADVSGINLVAVIDLEGFTIPIGSKLVFSGKGSEDLYFEYRFNKVELVDGKTTIAMDCSSGRLALYIVVTNGKTYDISCIPQVWIPQT